MSLCEGVLFFMKKPAVINHAGLSVSDLDAAVRWYGDVFGFREAGREYLPHVSTQLVTLSNGACELELFRHKDSLPLPPERSHPDPDLQTQGTKHFSLLVDDLYETLAFLKQYDGTEPIVGPGKVGRYLFCYIRDNSGIPIELQQISKDAEG